jgi:integrase
MGGPLLATTSGGRMRPSQLWELVRRRAAAAGIGEWDRLSAHSLRHTGITSLDAGVPLRERAGLRPPPRCPHHPPL